MKKKRIIILISGRGSNMQAIARNAREGLLRDCCEISLIFSNNPDAPGLRIAEAIGYPTAWILSQEKSRTCFERQMLELFNRYSPDYLVLAGFTRILSPSLVAQYPRRIVNIHPAEPAAFRGLHAYRWAWRQKLEKTVITVHYVDEGVDTGPVIEQREVDLCGADSLEEVERRGLAVEHRMYSEVLRRLFCQDRQANSGKETV